MRCTVQKLSTGRRISAERWPAAAVFRCVRHARLTGVWSRPGHATAGHVLPCRADRRALRGPGRFSWCAAAAARVRSDRQWSAARHGRLRIDRSSFWTVPASRRPVWQAPGPSRAINSPLTPCGAPMAPRLPCKSPAAWRADSGREPLSEDARPAPAGVDAP